MMGRANVEAELHRLDALSRKRALSEIESRVLEVMLKKQHTYDRLARNARAAQANRPARFTRAGQPTSDTLAASPAIVGEPTRSDPCAPGTTLNGSGE